MSVLSLLIVTTPRTEGHVRFGHLLKKGNTINLCLRIWFWPFYTGQVRNILRMLVFRIGFVPLLAKVNLFLCAFFAMGFLFATTLHLLSLEELPPLIWDSSHFLSWWVTGDYDNFDKCLWLSVLRTTTLENSSSHNQIIISHSISMCYTSGLAHILITVCNTADGARSLIHFYILSYLCACSFNQPS